MLLLVLDFKKFSTWQTTEVFSEETQSLQNETYWKAVAEATPLRKDAIYAQVSMVLLLVVNGVLPLVVLIVLNTKIYLAIKERMRRLASLTSRQKRWDWQIVSSGEIGNL